MTKTIKSGIAMARVLEDWGVDHLYGIPGGSFNSSMDAFFNERAKIKYIQVRHEEVGALAAAADAKVTGKLGVAFGSAGPGATHLFNGLYDAKMDHVPVLALIGQVATDTMNSDYFQEMNENPMFADVAVYNRTVMTAKQLPSVVDQAIRHAYKEKGVAVVTIPVNLGWQDIPDTFESTAANYRVNLPQPDDKDLDEILRLVEQAKQPMIYIGQGARGVSEEVQKFAEMYNLPIASSALAKGIIPDRNPAYLASAGRVATKPAVEALAVADLILFMGSDFPFAGYFFNPAAKFVQVDIDSSKFGKRHHVNLAVLADVKATLAGLIAKGSAQPTNKWYQANLDNNKNWHDWINKMAQSTKTPLRVEPIYKEINRIAKKDAAFLIDVGNVTIDSLRFLEMNPKQSFTTSGWFATMGYALPGGIAAQLSYPERQVFTISGDGGFTMVAQDLVTMAKYHLPVINVVLSNDSFGFIKAEQDDTKQSHYGVDIASVDFAKVAEGYGVKGFKVTNHDELVAAFDYAKTATEPVVIDVKIADERPIPVEQLKLDPEKFEQREIDEFNHVYDSYDLVPLSQYLK
ncbi:pyruvate oxidase [Lapidilactobacillus concavus DSM 17758]|uniref:Pyruvate oxidase n=1 Tax=Lapidilactobacillus concavus DSM 17758 TaxID=1423735 RepID=A0A0R1VY37_9LACO|nr:pyruvate oxidase [Lapidilactobacillus concavus]KRM10608.1 pyruvate oxidase [Lapidilactobacillus concavus DSM 17758]GEL12570.1 pyruvate oxidase [Lapidilactobacillus concavus]